MSEKSRIEKGNERSRRLNIARENIMESVKGGKIRNCNDIASEINK